MNVAICVATMNLDRLDRFIDGIPNEFFGLGGKIIVVITNNYDSSWYSYMNYLSVNSDVVHTIIAEQMPRLYSSVMKLKVDSCSSLLEEDTCVFMADDDYMFNKHCFEFASKIMETYPQVDYLSFTKGPGVIRDEQRVENFLGIDFQRLISTLGGAVIARWKTYKKHMEEYFQTYKVTDNDPGGAGMYDWHYFDTFLNTKYNGRKDNVYTILNPSLMQHCNLISHFMHTRRGPMDHMYAENFDPLINPLEIGIIENSYKEA